MLSDICPICGWVKENDSCPRCLGQARRNRPSHPSSAKETRGPRPERRQTQRTLDEAIDGRWVNDHYEIVIDIDVERGTYQRTREGYADREGSFSVVSCIGNSITFAMDDRRIKGKIGPTGTLELSAKKYRASFFYVYEGTEMLTCPQCFSKRIKSEHNCQECSPHLVV